MRNSLYTILKFALPVHLLALLSGCNECDLRSRAEPAQLTREQPGDKQRERPQLPLTIAPIRREASLNGLHLRTVEKALQEISAIPPSPFIVQKLPTGEFAVQGNGDFGKIGNEWFEAHRFAKNRMFWQINLAAAQIPQLARAVFEDLEHYRGKMQAAAEKLRDVVPGSVEFKDGVPQQGTLLYTGQMLDFALSDSGQPPQLFVDAGAPKFLLRAGRIVVRDGSVYLSDAARPLLDSKVPVGSTHLNLSADGRLIAYAADGVATDLGRLPLIWVKKFKPVPIGPPTAAETAPVEEYEKQFGKELVMPGHLEFAKSSEEWDTLTDLARARSCLFALYQALNSVPSAPPGGGAPEPQHQMLPLVVYAALPKSSEHLKALSIPVEKVNDRTSIGAGADKTAVTEALVKVLTGLRRRMEVHEENLRNAGKTRDAEGRLNPFKRKTIELGPQGVLIEGVDNSPPQKNYKPGDPDAGADGNVLMPNVNKAVETAEFKATIDEYKLLRIALERLAPTHIFPDPPPVP